MTERATIVDAVSADWLGRRYLASVVHGTAARYYPSSLLQRHRWTAAGAKRAGDRLIRRIERREQRDARRVRAARRATGYTS